MYDYKLLQRHYFITIFLDETWANYGHCVSKGWSHGTLKASRNLPSGKSLFPTQVARLGLCLIFYIYSSEEKTGDYQEDMQSWFLKLMEDISPNSTIGMDSTLYQTVVKEKPTTTAWKKGSHLKLAVKNNVVR